MSGGSLQGPFWRSIAVFRLAALAYAAALVARNFTDYAHPVLAWLVVGAMAGWTALAWWAYAHPAWRAGPRAWPLLATDLLVTAALDLTSPWVVGRSALDAGAPTLTVAWLAAPVLAWAVAGGRRRGLVAALLLGGVELVARGGLTQRTTTGVALMLLAGVAVGHVARLAVDAEVLPAVRVLMLSASGEQPDVLEAVKAGATGYLLKSAAVAEFVEAVRRTAAGEPVFTPGLAGLVLGEYRRLAATPARDADDAPRLTDRETEVLRLVAKGLSYKQLAARLGVSHRTVQNHVQNTLNKLHLHNRVELTRYAIERGLDA